MREVRTNLHSKEMPHTTEPPACTWLARRQAMLRQVRVERECEGWREIDRQLTRDQLSELQEQDSPSVSQSGVVWVEYYHDAVGWVIAKGYYDYGTREWIARYEPIGAGDTIKPVDAVAWLPIQAGVKPPRGLVIPKRLDCV